MKITPTTLKDGRTSFVYEFTLYGKHKRGACKGCKTLDEAKEYVARLQQKMSDIKRGLIDESSIITVQEMFESMLNSLPSNLSEGHVKNLKKDAERFIEYFGADTVIKSITTEQIECYRNMAQKTEGVNENTVKHRTATLSKAFNHIIINRRLGLFNPCRALKPYRIEVPPPRPVTLEEWNRLRVELPVYIYRISLVMLQTGLRPTQVKNLLWERLHFNEKIPYIEILKNDVGNKGKKRYTVPMTLILIKLFKEIGIKATGYVFPNPKTNKPYNDLRTAWKSACKRAGVGQMPLDKIVMYNLKDSVGTTMARSNVSATAIQHVFNHSSIEISEKYIGTVSEDTRIALNTMKDYT